MTYADKAKRRIELRKRMGAAAVDRLMDREAAKMRALATCNDIMWRVRMLRHSAGPIHGARRYWAAIDPASPKSSVVSAVRT